jgi:hypothetical protein
MARRTHHHDLHLTDLDTRPAPPTRAIPAAPHTTRRHEHRAPDHAAERHAVRAELHGIERDATGYEGDAPADR